MSELMDEQRQLIADFNEQLMEAQTERDQHYENQRELFNERRRTRKCTNCAARLYRGHFHVVGNGHSVCCTCVPKVQVDKGGIKTLRATIRARALSRGE